MQRVLHALRIAARERAATLRHERPAVTEVRRCDGVEQSPVAIEPLEQGRPVEDCFAPALRLSVRAPGTQALDCGEERGRLDGLDQAFRRPGTLSGLPAWHWRLAQ